MTDHHQQRRFDRPGVRFVAVVVLLVAALAGCEQQGPSNYFTYVPQPSVPSGTRYVDEVFPNVDKTSNIHYSTADDLNGNAVSLDLDLYQPAGDTATTRPAVVLVHGGGFTGGTKTNSTMVTLANHFARIGYVAVSINYRLLSPTGCGGGSFTTICAQAGTAGTSDAQSAVRWLRNHAATYRIDPDRVAMMGASAGGVVSILAGSIPGLADEPTNSWSTLLMAGTPRNTSNPGPSSAVTAWASISGGLPPQITGLYGGLGQVLADNFTELPSPGYFFHGTNDTTVPYSWAEGTRDQLLDIHRFIGFMAFSGLGHVESLMHNVGSTIIDQSTWFFDLLLDVGALNS